MFGWQWRAQSALAAALFAAAAASAATVGGLESLDIGASGSTSGSVNYAYRDSLHMSLPSTAATLSTQYNSLFRPLYGGMWSGVAALELQNRGGPLGCTGALLSSGQQILTAAHCVTDSAGALTLESGTAYFATMADGAYTGTREAVHFSTVTVHPDWAGKSFLGGNDIAVITLDTVAPEGAQRYDLYTGFDEIGKAHDRVGWGQVGTGDGTVLAAGGFRTGQNVYDLSGAVVDPALGHAANPAVLYYDFDDGVYDAALGFGPHDALGYWFGVHDLGLGDTESIAAPGDSGGPTFIDGRIAGVTSFNVTFWDSSGHTTDVDSPYGGPDGSFGEIGGDTRVSFYVDWIRAQAVPEPAAWMLMGAGLLGLACRRRRA